MEHTTALCGLLSGHCEYALARTESLVKRTGIAQPKTRGLPTAAAADNVHHIVQCRLKPSKTQLAGSESNEI